jgi:hypothetical protein
VLVHESLLTKLAGAGDPVADRVTKSILDRGEINQINRLLGRLLDNDDIPDECRFPEVLAFLQATRELPEWTDPDRIHNAERVFARYGAMAYVGLACASLPECYYDSHIARILGSTHRFESDVHRRFFETVQLVIEVMSPGGLLDPNGRGVITCQKVRLMHAAIRCLVRARPPAAGALEATRAIPDRLEALNWNDESWPVDQPALAMTLQTCAASVLRSWEILGVVLDESEKDDYVHAWSVVGFLLGVDEQLLPANAAEAQALFGLLKRYRQQPTVQGRNLTRALLAFVQSLLPWYAAAAPRALTRTLIGDEVADGLGVERLGGVESVFHHGVIRTLRILNFHRKVLYGVVPGSALAWEWLSRSLIEAMIRFDPHENARALRIPSELSRGWRARRGRG